jgi:hypothetical protein
VRCPARLWSKSPCFPQLHCKFSAEIEALGGGTAEGTLGAKGWAQRWACRRQQAAGAAAGTARPVPSAAGCVPCAGRRGRTRAQPLTRSSFCPPKKSRKAASTCRSITTSRSTLPSTPSGHPGHRASRSAAIAGKGAHSVQNWETHCSPPTGLPACAAGLSGDSCVGWWPNECVKGPLPLTFLQDRLPTC